MKTRLISFVVVGCAGMAVACFVPRMARTFMGSTPPQSSVSSRPVAAAPSPQPTPRAPADTAGHVVKTSHEHATSDFTTVGTVTPEDVVEVGAQVSGMIEAFGSDPTDPSKPIDQGSMVRKGTVLAQIDPTIYLAQVDYSEASLQRAKADLSQLQAKYDQLKQEWLRAKSLLPQKAIAGSEYDLALANYQVAAANVAVGQAAIQQCEATLRVAKTNLKYTVIKSPIDGVVIDRRVNVGQTVVASFNVPGLFLIAKDLHCVQVWAAVDETEIGRIHPGLPAKFTVDAYPGEVFEGKVTQIRLNPTKSQNRTSYTVVVATERSHGMLPYLTAKLRFEINRYANEQSICNRPLQKPQSATKNDVRAVAAK
jgi:HlyD family secretion protein